MPIAPIFCVQYTIPYSLQKSNHFRQLQMGSNRQSHPKMAKPPPEDILLPAAVFHLILLCRLLGIGRLGHGIWVLQRIADRLDEDILFHLSQGQIDVRVAHIGILQVVAANR